MKIKAFHVLIACLIIFFSCAEQKKATLFELLNNENIGVNFENTVEFKSDQNIIDYLYFYNGGGVSTGDINNDGLIDFFLTANQKSNQLYLNKGNFIFENISLSAGIIQDSMWSTGTSMVDINGDGYLDIYVCNVGNYKSFQGTNRLYVNNGDSSFSEMASEYGLNFSGFSTHSSFLDYDHDGDLDMYLLNHSVHTPRSYRNASTRSEIDSLSGDRFYENLLNEGEQYFRNVTSDVGIYSSSQGFGLGVVASDINKDGFIDIYVGNDFHENDYLYINDGDGSFTESIEDYIQHTSRFSMGVDIADLNNDNLSDILSLDMLPNNPDILLKSGGEDMNQVLDIKLEFGYEPQYARNTLQINRGNNKFSELGILTDIYATDWSWSTLIADYDNDGNSDIFISNGIYKRPNDLDYINYLNQPNTPENSNSDSYKLNLIEQMPQLKIPNVAFRGVGELGFENAATSWGLNDATFSNGTSYADLDNDGDLDLIINNVNQAAYIYENNAAHLLSNNYVQLELFDSEGLNPYALGANVTVYSGTRSWYREVSASRGFQSSISSRINVGIGKVAAIDSVRVQWPDATIQLVRSTKINSIIKINKLGSRLLDRPFGKQVNSFDFPFRHVEDDFDDYNYDQLIPHKLSTEGPASAQGDIDGDGIDELYIGGAHGQSGQLFFNKDGDWVAIRIEAFEKDAFTEDVDAQFYDIDSDSDLDLYVVSGGNRFPQTSPELEDRIYINDSSGNFERMVIDLPSTNGGCVSISDFNKDGITDFFVGARSVPGSYGKTPTSFVFSINNSLLEVLSEWNLGMVTDATWDDLNNDEFLDLVVVGEWMPLTILENNGIGGLVNKTDKLQLEKVSSGWWNSIEIVDLNNDGLKDVIAGNLGLNTKLKPTVESPCYLYVEDFDNNGQTDPIIFYSFKNENIPLASKDELVGQIPSLKKKFTTYESFSNVRSINDIIDKEPSIFKEVQTMSSSVFMNKGGGEYEIIKLPVEAQWSPIQDIFPIDINNDGHIDLLSVGNFHGALAQLGRQDASAGAIFLNNREGGFSFYDWLPLDPDQEFRKIEDLGDQLLFISNNASPTILNKKDLK